MFAAFAVASASLFEKKLPDRGVPTRAALNFDKRTILRQMAQRPTKQFWKSFPILFHQCCDNTAPTRPELRPGLEEARFIEDLQDRRLPQFEGLSDSRQAA